MASVIWEVLFTSLRSGTCSLSDSFHPLQFHADLQVWFSAWSLFCSWMSDKMGGPINVKWIQLVRVMILIPMAPDGISHHKYLESNEITLLVVWAETIYSIIPNIFLSCLFSKAFIFSTSSNPVEVGSRGNVWTHFGDETNSDQRLESGALGFLFSLLFLLSFFFSLLVFCPAFSFCLLIYL